MTAPARASLPASFEPRASWYGWDASGRLAVDRRPLAALFEGYPTPFYLYDARTIRENARFFQTELRAALPGHTLRSFFAVKANDRLAILRLMHQAGLGFDIVSWGEGQRVLAAGARADAMVFSGVGKTPDEIRAALEAGLGVLHLESDEELACLLTLLGSGSFPAYKDRRVGVAIRLNPATQVASHAYISTGHAASKFGVPPDLAMAMVRKIQQSPLLSFEGLAVHLGSQLTQLEDFARGFGRLASFCEALVEADLPLPEALSLGGGLGVAYQNEPEIALAAYGACIRETLGHLPIGTLCFEPGRRLIAQAGILVMRVIRRKNLPQRRWLVVDGSMTELLRPALYGVRHNFLPDSLPDSSAGSAALHPVDLVGPVCESSDCFARGLLLPPLEAGAYLIAESCGAYGSVMANAYNARALPAEWLYEDGKMVQICQAWGVSELLGRETLAS